MFGHQNDQQDGQQADMPVDGQINATAPPVDNNLTVPTASPDMELPAALTEDTSVSPPADTSFTPPLDVSANAGDLESVSAPDLDTATPSENNANELLDIKQQALGQLSPLVGHLEQTPVEKFRTTMMMIQASDNQSLIKDAYAAAQSIDDEKTRAQALLDVINEINYFTQHNEKS